MAEDMMDKAKARWQAAQDKAKGISTNTKAKIQDKQSDFKQGTDKQHH